MSDEDYQIIRKKHREGVLYDRINFARVGLEKESLIKLFYDFRRCIRIPQILADTGRRCS